MDAGDSLYKKSPITNIPSTKDLKPIALMHYENGDVNYEYYNFSFNTNHTLDFFDIYYSTPRFVIETMMAFAAIIANIFTIFLLLKGSAKQKGTAHRILFYNLSAANTLCCVLSWMANNSFLLFEHRIHTIMREPDGWCHVILRLMAAMFVSVAFGTESCITMLGFTAVQYRSVSRPLVHWAMTRQKMAYIFLAVSWFLTFLFGCVPFVILLGMTNATECTENIHKQAMSIVIIGATLAISIESITYVSVIVLSMLIYIKLRRYGQGFWNIRFYNQIRSQKRTFATTLMLFVTLVLFSLPYMILYIVTLTANNTSNIQESALIHYMNILPYLKFLTDPIIYGMRMREVKESWFRLMVKCGLEKCACSREEFSTPRSPPPYMMHQVTFV